tara:strand:+ start:1589 stop:1819 length:231 start_codon:yes stop_codon:yes gene_type:complete
MITSVRLPPDLNKRLEKLALSTGRPRSYYIVKALEEYLDNKENKLLELGNLYNSKEISSDPDKMKKVIEIARNLQK